MQITKIKVLNGDVTVKWIETVSGNEDTFTLESAILDTHPLARALRDVAVDFDRIVEFLQQVNKEEHPSLVFQASFTHSNGAWSVVYSGKVAISGNPKSITINAPRRTEAIDTGEWTDNSLSEAATKRATALMLSAATFAKARRQEASKQLEMDLPKGKKKQDKPPVPSS